MGMIDRGESWRGFFEEALHQVGHSVVTVSSGEEALDRLRDARVDLIMMLGGRVV
jgi:CheY-like chemotaxis protein